jgi:PEP-CTERM motif
MKNSSPKTLVALAIALLSSAALCEQARAQNPVSGHITWAGGVSLNTSSAATATEVTAWHSQATPDTGKPEVQTVDGNWASFINPGDGTTFQPNWFFNTTTPIPNFWSVDGFTFSLTASAIPPGGQGGTPGTSGFVFVSGTGTVSGNGFTTTPGTFSFSTQDPGAGSPQVFSFSAASAVPEPGTGALIGIGGVCFGCAAARRKLRNRSI